MIWSSTREGHITYAGPEWVEYTGQSLEAALGDGWLDMLHPDDRARTDEFFKLACASASPFTVRYRLRRPDGTYTMMISGAAPSVSPIDGSFLGYLGALSEVPPKDASQDQTNKIGKFAPLTPTPATTPRSTVDLIADYLLMARSTAEISGEDRLLASLDFALSEVMRRLGYPSMEGAH